MCQAICKYILVGEIKYCLREGKRGCSVSSRLRSTERPGAVGVRGAPCLGLRVHGGKFRRQHALPERRSRHLLVVTLRSQPVPSRLETVASIFSHCCPHARWEERKESNFVAFPLRPLWVGGLCRDLAVDFSDCDSFRVQVSGFVT